MQFGAHIFGVGAMAEPATLVEVARLAEQLGYHALFLADHILVPHNLASQSAAGRSAADFVVSAFPTDRFTLDLVHQFAAHGVQHMLHPVFSFEREKVLQRLEQIATQVMQPYQGGT